MADTHARNDRSACWTGRSKLDRRGFLAGAATAALGVAATGVAARLALAGDQAKPPVIDTHMHVWSGDPERWPFAHPYDDGYVAPPIAATVEILVDEMDEGGVDYCVLVQTICHGWDNSYLVHCLRAHPERFRGHGLIDPTDPAVAEKLDYWVREQGLAGMRFSPMYYPGRDEWLNARESDALWRKAGELGAVFNFFIAAGQLPKLKEMTRRFPDVPVVIDHVGRIDLKAAHPQAEIDYLLAMAESPNVWVKISELSSITVGGEYPFRDTYDSVRQVYDAFGPERLLWGTGFPGATRAQADRPSLEQELDVIRRHLEFLTPADREKILGANAAGLWKFAAVQSE